MTDTLSTPTYTTIPVRELGETELTTLSSNMKLSLSTEDMLAVQAHYKELDRDPTCVELEVIAQTWSEHCKHRIFNAYITHETPEGTETVDSLFKTYIRDVSQKIFDRKPGFVLSAFHDNAGFIELDENLAACLKLETHNHPSAIEPYAGANTGIGGVIRDIIGAGLGATPVASLDIFCFGRPDKEYDKELEHVIHPIGIMRGVVRGVRDYGNRMGIPTVGGAIYFEDGYLYNPLVFCGTAGVIDRTKIDKEIKTGHWVCGVGGRTGKDGLHGATFSSASLSTDSQVEDQQAVQIGNPIEEKKAADFILRARDEGLLENVTDCGAGGWSSAAGEMLSEIGGEFYLDNVPLKEPGMSSWEIFLSESQERMVFATDPKNWDRLQEIADMYQTELSHIGTATGSKRLIVLHNGETVCDLGAEFLHEAPQKKFTSSGDPAKHPASVPQISDFVQHLRSLMSDINLCSREPIIREYDHEVQGNTVGKPLAGAGGDCPQDGAVLRVDGSDKYLALGLSVLPQYGHTHPREMGRGTVDECVRQLVLRGANPDKLAILDNFCMGNPDEPEELGRLVESVKGITEAADAFGAPFVSGKDSFYNYFETDEGSVSIPMTILVSGMGVVDHSADVTHSSLRHSGSHIGLIGLTKDEVVPDIDAADALARYRLFHKAVQNGWIQSGRDCCEGGLAAALAEFGFSLKAGLDIDPLKVPAQGELEPATLLFSESAGRLVIEVSPEHVAQVEALFQGQPFAWIGESTDTHELLNITGLVSEPLSELKALWKNGLTPYY